MIRNAPLTPEQRRKSQWYYHIFNTLNGFAYICLGETVIILLAVKVGCSNFVISALGGMVYFGYLLLPLGLRVTAVRGAVRCQEFFWVIRNLAALAVAAAVPVHLYVSRPLAVFLILFGGFVFYGARAAGVVVIQPLFGEITSSHDRAQFIAGNSRTGYGMGFLALGCITALLYFTSNSLWVLTGIVLFGGFLGIAASRFLGRIDETGQLMLLARKPVLSELRALLADRVFRRLIAAHAIINMALIMLVPISVLTIKRGYGISDSVALLYSVFQLGASTFCAFALLRPIRKIGPRRFACIIYCLLLCIGPLWAFAPEHPDKLHLAAVFFLCGVGSVCTYNALSIYFLQMIEEKRRIMGSILNAVLPGAGAGICGILLTGFLLKYLAADSDPATAMTLYRHYYMIASLLLLPGLFVIGAMKPMPIEKRTAWHAFDWFTPKF